MESGKEISYLDRNCCRKDTKTGRFATGIS